MLATWWKLKQVAEAYHPSVTNEAICNPESRLTRLTKYPSSVIRTSSRVPVNPFMITRSSQENPLRADGQMLRAYNAVLMNLAVSVQPEHRIDQEHLDDNTLRLQRLVFIKARRDENLRQLAL